MTDLQAILDTKPLHSELKKKSVRGGAFTAVAQSARLGLQMTSQVVLARLLAPADFGLIAMVMVVTNFAVMFRTLGLSTATIQAEDLRHEQVSALFWINVGVGVFLAVAVVLVAPVVAWFYDDPRLIPVTSVLAVTFLISGIGVQHEAILQRQMKFFELGLIEVLAMAVGVTVAIVTGVFGAGYWALVAMHVTIAVVSTVGRFVAGGWLPGPPRRTEGIRDLLKFGGNVTGFNIVNYFSRNADNIIIGRFLGATTLGFYSKAYSLLMLPIQQIRGPLGAVGMPALSRLRESPAEYRRYYMRLVQILAFCTVPMAAVLGAYSEEIITLVLGSQWVPAARIFAVLSLVAIVQPSAGTSGMVMLSFGLSQRYFRIGVVHAVVTVAAFFAGLPWGVMGVATSYTIAVYVTLLPFLVYEFRGTPVTTRDFFRSIHIPVYATAGAIVLSRFVYSLLHMLPYHLDLFAAIGIAGIGYLLFFYLLPGGRGVLRNTWSTFQLVFRRA